MITSSSIGRVVCGACNGRTVTINRSWEVRSHNGLDGERCVNSGMDMFAPMLERSGLDIAAANFDLDELLASAPTDVA